MSRRCCATPRERRRPRRAAHLVVTRPDGVEYRRSVVPDQGIGGRSLDVPIISSAPTGTWRVAAYHRPEAARHRRGDLPGRGLCAGSARIRSHHHGHQHLARLARQDRCWTAASSTARQPRASTLDGEINIAKATELPGFAGYVFGLDDDSDAEQDDESDTIPLADLPETDSAGKASFTATLDKVPASTRPQQAEIVVRMAEARRPRGRAQAHAAHHAVSTHDRREAAVHRQGARRFRHGKLRRGHGRARRQSHGQDRASLAVAAASIPNISGIATKAIGSTSRSR